MASELKHWPTAPISPTPEKKQKGMGFLKRHLAHRRRSSTSIPNRPTTSPQTQRPQTPSPQVQNSKTPNQQTQTPQTPSQQIQTPQIITTPPASPTPGQPNPPKSAIRKPSISSNDELSKVVSIGTDASGEEATRQGSKAGGVKWATGFDVPSQPSRQRRTSSAGTMRRNSIFFRVEGNYLEGVDAGAGSKARRLSVAIPTELQVEECPLADHFSLLSRAGKKDIGEGGAAVVRLMQSKTAGTGKDKLFAVKEFREWEPDEEKESEYERKIKSEYAIAKSCQHPNIVETFRLCHSDKKWFHVMEYCDLGDLNDLINKEYFSRDDRNCMFKQLLRGVEYLHARGIAHRDLKSENLLLTRNGCLKIADFGTAEVFSGTHPGLKGCRRQSIIEKGAEIRLCAPGLVGSRPYMAPEIIKHEEKYDPRGVDIWSCAIVYVTMCVGGTPWDCASTDVKNYNIFCRTWDDWLEKYPDGILKKGRQLPAFVGTPQFQQLGDIGTKTLVMGMLNPDPTKRWSAHDALDSVTVMEFPCCQQEGYSDDIKTRQRKAMHNHVPPKSAKGSKFSKPK